LKRGALSTVHAEQWRWCSEEEEEGGRGADLRWLRGGAAGGFRPENGLDGGWGFCFFSALFFFFCSVSVFSVFLLLAASVSCFSFLLLFLMVAAVVCGATVAHGGGAMVALLCGGGQCPLLFFLSL
jgi:hypothetical protein